MAEESKGQAAAPEAFGRAVNAQIERKLRGRAAGEPTVPFGLGMMGLVGWSISIPTLLGAALGLWLDHHRPQAHSWTLALLMAGLTIGCWTAWRWVMRETATLHRTDQDEP